MTPDYEKLATLLSTSNIFNSVSELHGVVSGQICAGVLIVKAELTRQLMGIDEPFSSVIEQLVVRLGKELIEQLEEGDFSFQPLLPDDDEELTIRLHALGEWCEAFNVGFGGGFGKGDQSILEETREVLKDFSEISQIENAEQNQTEQEENEQSYMEIVEYVRMAVATVYMQNGKDIKSPIENNIH